MTTSLSILLFAPRLRDGTDYEAVLASRGWSVERATTPRSFQTLLKARPVDLVVLDDPAFELVRFAVAAMDAMEDPVPRIWVSSLTEAPGESARLGIDSLLLVPVDAARLAEHVAALLMPRGHTRSGSHPTFPLGSQLGTPIPAGLATPVPAPTTTETNVGLRPRAVRQRTDGGWEEESTGNWP